MNRLLSPKMVWSSMTAVSIALLSGCSNLQPATAPANASEFTNVGAAAPLALPDAARLRISATEALSGQGMYYFDDDKAARLYIAQDKSSKDRFLVKESFDQGVPHGLPWGTGAQALVYDGVAVKPENILSATPNRDGSLSITYGDHPSMKINMKLEAFDVSGMFVRDFLRTRGNQPTLSASFVSPERKFLAGSVAYAMTLWVDQDEVLVPNLKGFTGANSIEDFSKRFAGNTPYCLRFLPGNIVQPMGMGFKEPIKGKITKVKGKSVEEEQSGRVSLYAAKKNTVFCSRERNDELTLADWQLKRVNGTRVLEFKFPGNVPAASFGMTEKNRNHLSTGVAEVLVQEGKKKVTRAVPVYVWHKGAPVRDSQYRFNETAAKVVEVALAEAAPLRQKWELANENDVLRRAKAIDAANAPKVVPTKTLPAKNSKARAAVQKKVNKSTNTKAKKK